MLLFIQWGNSTKLFIKMNKAVSYSGATTYIFCWLRCSSQQKTDLKKNNNVWRVSEHVLYVSAPLLLTPPHPPPLMFSDNEWRWWTPWWYFVASVVVCVLHTDWSLHVSSKPPLCRTEGWEETWKQHSVSCWESKRDHGRGRHRNTNKSNRTTLSEFVESSAPSCWGVWVGEGVS